MLSKSRRRRILVLALPIIGGMVSQNVLNLVDTAMVGVLGDSALAAVGMGGIMNFLLSSFILGLGAGVQAMAARRVGEGRKDVCAVPLNGGLLLANALALPWTAALWFLVPVLFSLLTEDQTVVDQGIPYVRARLLAMAAMGMNFSFRGFWNATDRSALYMRTLVFMHLVNIGLNWVFIYGNLGCPAYGATGAGMASALSTWLGVGYYFLLGWTRVRPEGFLHGLPSKDVVWGMLRLSVPAGLQQLFFSGGLMAFYAIVALLGTREVAATNVVVNLFLVGILPGLGFGLASLSLVGQALGRKEVVEARQWGWDVARLAAIVVGLISLPGMLVPELLLAGFLHDPQTRALGVWPLRLVSIGLSFDALGSVLMNSLMGAGDTKRVMMVTTSLQWGVFLPTAWLFGYWLGFGLTVVWMAQVAYRSIQTLTFMGLWQGDRWTHIKV